MAGEELHPTNNHLQLRGSVSLAYASGCMEAFYGSAHAQTALPGGIAEEPFVSSEVYQSAASTGAPNMVLNPSWELQ